MITYNEILTFWFNEEHKKHWFSTSDAFDQKIKKQFSNALQHAANREFDHWKNEPKSALALVLILDQFSRNLFRNQADTYAHDAYALEVASYAIDQGLDEQLSSEEKSFLYMPFMHSESLDDQDRSVELFDKANLETNLRYAIHHRDIVRKFGRFPHRNKMLGRTNSKEEEAYLNSPEAFDPNA